MDWAVCNLLPGKENWNVYCWGLNNYYQLSFADMVNRYAPERVMYFDPAK